MTTKAGSNPIDPEIELGLWTGSGERNRSMCWFKLVGLRMAQGRRGCGPKLMYNTFPFPESEWVMAACPIVGSGDEK